MIEPVCECSDVYSRRHGMLVDEDDRKGPGPHEGCYCDVCHYGIRKAWLAGRASRDEEVAGLQASLAYRRTSMAQWWIDHKRITDRLRGDIARMADVVDRAKAIARNDVAGDRSRTWIDHEYTPRRLIALAHALDALGETPTE